MSLHHHAVGPGDTRTANDGGEQPSSRVEARLGPDGTTQWWIELDPSPRSAALARMVVADLLTSQGLDGFAEIASLLTSELVTNAVLHSRTPVTLVADVVAGRLRVEAIDGSSVLPVPRALTADDLGGRGLIIVDRLATSWGHEARANGKAVWFELAV